VQIDFDKPRELRFDLRAIKDLEAAMGGMPLGDVVGQLSRVGVTAISAALWAGLKHEDKALTPNLVTKMLQAYIDAKHKQKNLRVLARALNQAIEETGLFRSDADDDEETEGNGQAAVPA
jgi:hypothetical protein